MLRGAATEDLPALAVLVHHPDPDHCGILYAADTHRVMLHLAWHKILLHEPIPSPKKEKYAWVAPALPPERALAVARLCARVWRAHRRYGLPYGLRYDATTFHRTGEVKLGPDEVGLTCATFVIAVFRRGGVELLRQQEWPDRPDDVDRQRELVAALRDDPKVPRAHCDAIEREIGAVRYRPTEVAGACASSELPCSFVDAANAAAQIASAFDSLRST
jgi:hypothetical protein